MPQDTTSTTDFVPGLPAERLDRFVPPAPPGFHSWPECLFDQALKEFTTEDTADQVADDCAIALSDPNNPYTQHVLDAMRMLVCHVQFDRVQQQIGENLLRRFKAAEARG